MDMGHWIKPVLNSLDSVEQPGFEWPALIAACMPSVATRFEAHPPEPRLFAMQHAELQDIGRRYLEATSSTYDDSACTNAILLKWLALKVDASNRVFSTSGNPYIRDLTYIVLHIFIFL